MTLMDTEHLNRVLNTQMPVLRHFSILFGTIRHNLRHEVAGITPEFRNNQKCCFHNPLSSKMLCITCIFRGNQLSLKILLLYIMKNKYGETPVPLTKLHIQKNLTMVFLGLKHFSRKQIMWAEHFLMLRRSVQSSVAPIRRSQSSQHLPTDDGSCSPATSQGDGHMFLIYFCSCLEENTSPQFPDAGRL